MKEFIASALLIIILGMTLFAVVEGIKEVSDKVTQMGKVGDSLDHL